MRQRPQQGRIRGGRGAVQQGGPADLQWESRQRRRQFLPSAGPHRHAEAHIEFTFVQAADAVGLLQYRLGAGAVGVTHAQVENGDVSARAVVLPLQSNPRAKMRSLKHGFVKLFCRRNSGLVIGGVIVAPTASELILPIAIAVSNNLTVKQLAEVFAVYPSLSGSITEAARRLVATDDLA